MKPLHFIPVALMLLSACDPSLMGPRTPAVGPVQMTPVRWKTNTPVQRRGQDVRECEYAAVGARPDSSEEQIRAMTEQVSQEQFITFVDRCMSNKGYTVTDGVVCRPGDERVGQFMVGRTVDNLPPLSRVHCFDPGSGGFILKA